MDGAATMPATLKDRYAAVRQRIADAARASGRNPDAVVLVAVCKHAEPEQIRELIQLGHLDFGENQVQQLVQRAAMVDEFLARQKVLTTTLHPGAGAGAPSPEPGLFGPLLPVGAHARPGDGVRLPPAVRWHMIGHLQRNKARKAVELCRLIHSVDSLRLAEELQTIGLKRDRPIDALLQVDFTGRATRSGCAPAAAVHLAEQIETMAFVRLRGVMTIAEPTADPNDARPTFARCRELFREIAARGVGEGAFNILSMGMSHDFEPAVLEGANMVRVGTAIFGAGQTPPAFDEGDRRERP